MPRGLAMDKYCKILQVFIEYLANFYSFGFNVSVITVKVCIHMIKKHFIPLK